jgi:hypothetical protein
MAKQDISIEDLVAKITSGELVLPEMQRRYVWTAAKVRDLLDSLYREYPSGTILVWEINEGEAPTRTLDIAQNKSPLKGRLLLLDGQQRLTSLVALFTNKPVKVKNSTRPVDIMFNLEHPEGLPSIEAFEDDEEEEELNGDDTDSADEALEDMGDNEIQDYLKRMTFVVYSKALEGIPTWVRVTDIFNKGNNEIFKQLGITSFDDPRVSKYTQRLDRVRGIRKYQYVMNILGQNFDYDEVTEIFVRVNSAGVKLRSSDLALAQITAKWNHSLQEFESYAKEMGDTGYDVDISLLIRAIVVFATEQSRFKTVGTLQKQRLQEGWESAKSGIEFAVNFLRNNTQIENLSFLSSPFVLIPACILAVIRDEKISATEETALKRWIYLAHSFGHYSKGSSESILDADISALMKKKGRVDDLITILQRQFGRLKFDEMDIKAKGKRSPLFSMAYLAVKQNGGKDWQTGLALSQNNRGKSHKIEFHHIFPRVLLQRAGYEKAEINEIANMGFLGGKTNRRISAKPPVEYLEQIVSERGESALTSQFVPLDRNLWKIENYRQFLEERRKLLIQHINKFLE